MMQYSVFTQIVIAVIAVVIVATFVRPQFLEISALQDDIAMYDEAIAQVAAVNRQLAALVSTMDSVPAADRRALLTYMPDVVDEIAILKDLERIAADAGVTVSALSYNGHIPPPRAAVAEGAPLTDPIAHEFSLSIVGTYDQLKSVLRTLEQNDYPLHVYAMSLAPTTEQGATSVSDELELALTLQTYSRVVPAENPAAGRAERSNRR